MNRNFLPALALLAAATGASHAASSVNLNFDGTQGGVANTGFEAVYNEDTTGFSLTPGGLSINTLPGDTYGDYEDAVNSAKNVFYTNLDPTTTTEVDAVMTISGLNADFHGGGIWLGEDENHYIRDGIVYNDFANPVNGISSEGLRENEDLWPGAGGPGGDIIGVDNAVAGATNPLTVNLRILQHGSHVDAEYSTDGGMNFIDTNSVDGFATSAPLKAGVYAFGGPAGVPAATAVFRSFSVSTRNDVPEPASLALLLGGLPMVAGLARRRRS